MATGLENRARNSLRTMMAESENINAFCAKERERDTSREIERNNAMSKEGEREKQEKS
jgi:hypothetical protein